MPDMNAVDEVGLGPRAAGRRPRVALWAALAVAVVVAALVAVLAVSRSATGTVASSPLLGKPAPEIAGTAVDGRRVRLADLRGRFVVVNFFATWCVPCQQEQPELVAFNQRHAAAGDATILMVVFHDEPATVRSFQAKHGGTWPAVPDPGGDIALSYGVTGPPETYLVDPAGVVITRIIGPLRVANLEQLLNQAKAADA